MSPTVLIIMVGGTFRLGGRFSLQIGEEDAFDDQKLAAESHMKFRDLLRTKYDTEAEFLLNTYSTKFDEQLRSWYPPESRAYFLNGPMVQYDNLLNDAVAKASDSTFFEKYSAVIFIRIDLFLKPEFFDHFKLFDKLTFPFIEHDHFMDRSPIVNDLIFYVPRKYFYIFAYKTVSLHHGSFGDYVADHIGLMVDTMNYSGHDICPNPIYRIVNRSEAPDDPVKCRRVSYKNQGFNFKDDEKFDKMPKLLGASSIASRAYSYRLFTGWIFAGFASLFILYLLARAIVS